MKTVNNSLLVFLAVLFATISAIAQSSAPVALDVPYVPTEQSVVNAMLKVAKVSKNDVVYDLGCGDGRIVITAAKEYGATGTGIDINPERIKEAKENARQANVSNKVNFNVGNLFETDFSKASVVTLYLLPEVNMKLRPILLKQLKPGSRIVSHDFDMGDWVPDETIQMDGATIYFWTVPKK
jgi:SAM-dependent methyltransferase